MAHPDFGRSVNLISTRGTNYAHLITTGTPGFSDLPTALCLAVWQCARRKPNGLNLRFCTAVKLCLSNMLVRHSGRKCNYFLMFSVFSKGREWISHCSYLFLTRIKGSYVAVWCCCSFQWRKYFVYQIINVFSQLVISVKFEKRWTKYHFYQYCRIDNSAKNDVAVLIFISIFKLGEEWNKIL